MKSLHYCWRHSTQVCLTIFFFLSTLALSASSISGSTSVCEGDIITYSHSYTPGYTYNWGATGGTGIATINTGSGTAVFTVTWGLAGPGTITLQEYSGPTLIGNHSINITINNAPNPMIVSDFDSDCVDPPGKEGQHVRPPSFDCETVCEDSPVNYTTSFVSGNSYLWTVIGSYNSISGATTNFATVTWGSPGQAYVVITETTPSGCTQTDTTCIIIVEKPKAEFKVDQGNGAIFSSPSSSSVNTVVICKDATVCFDDLSVGGNSWFWDFGNGNTSQQASPCETFTTPGVYLVRQIVENECYCTDTSYIEVKVTSLEGPDIVCQNVICSNGTFIYDAILPVPCSGGFYDWSISNNGTIVSLNGTGTSISPQTASGTNSTSIGINWGSGPIGVISLKLSGCGGVCDRITTVNIPIIPNNLDITGDEVVCVGDFGYYEVPCFPGTKYNWKVIDQSNNVVATGGFEHDFNYQFFIAGSYTITVDYTNSFLSCSGSSYSFPVEVLLPFSLSGANKACEGTTTTISGPGSSQLTWEVINQSGTVVATGGTASSYAIPTTLLPGSYTISAKDVSSPRDYCNDYAVHGITIIASPPAPTVINGAIEVCLNEVNVYTASPTSSNYYLEWEVNNNGSVTTSNGNSVTISWTGATKTITLYHVSKVGNCKSTGYTLPIIDKTPPAIITIGGPANVCANTDALAPKIYNTTAILDGYIWSIIPANAGSVVAGQGTNTISVIWNNWGGTANVRLTPEMCNVSYSSINYPVVVAAPVMSIAGPATVCENSGGSWSASFAPAGSPTLQTWKITDINGNIVANGTGSTANFNFSNLSGSFILTMTATNCVIVHTETFNILVNPAPVANLSYTGGIGCIDLQNATLLLSVQGAGSYSYNWIHNGTPLGNLGTSHGIGMNPLDAGNWLVRVTNTVTGCSSQTNIVRASPCGPPPPMCNPHPSTINFNSNVSQIAPSPGCNFVNFNSGFTGMTPTSYLWDFAGLATASGPNPNFIFPASGVYPVTVIASYGGGFCDKSVTIDVIVPIITDFEINISCAGGSVLNVDLINTTDVIFGPLNAANYNFNWSVIDVSGPITVASSINQDFIGVTGLVGGTTYDVVLVVTRIATGDVCTYTETFVMPENAAANFNIINPTVCEGNPVTFNDASSGNIIRREWMFGDLPLSTILTTNPEKTYTVPGIYNVTLEVTDEYGCVNTSAAQQVDVKANAIAGNISISPAQPMCPGLTATILFNHTGSGYAPFSYLWSDNTTAISTSSMQTSTHYLGVTDNVGCFASFGPATVEVVEIPLAVITGEDEYCVGDEISLVCNYGSSYTYNWFKFMAGTGSYVAAGSGTDLNIASAPVGTHLFKVELVASGCIKESLVFTVVVHPNPVAPIITTNPTPACPDSPVLLTATNAAAFNYVTWSTGDVSPTTYANTSGVYYAVGTDANGCSNYSSTNVFELPDFCSFMCGCYSDCIDQSGTYNFPGILGNFAQWRWEQFIGGSWVPGLSGTGTVSDFVATGPGTYTIRLYVKTYDGCDGYSCETDLTLVPCNSEPCEGKAYMKYIKCYEDSDLGASYRFDLVVDFAAFGAPCNKFTYTIVPPSGSIPPGYLNPAPYINPYGDNITGVWNTGVSYFPGGVICFDIIITNECDSSTCMFTVCFDVEPCGKPDAQGDIPNSRRRLKNGSNDLNGGVQFYPNPTTGMLKIKAPEKGNYQITIFDISGQVVFKHNILIEADRVAEFNLINLPVGAYSVQCIGNEMIKTERLIIIKE
ncbi:MAG: PKD domain-containing protein [Flavobacteriales bacterium]|nr:PKD domain-containing protein [Flavobacteriales bacterium]